MSAHIDKKTIPGVSGTVVVGVDGSSASLDALEWAAEQAQLTGRDLVPILVWQRPTAYAASVSLPSDPDFEEIAEKELHNALDKQLGARYAEHTRPTVIRGQAGHVLCDASKTSALLVVGARGHGEVAGLLLGSVSEHVAAHAHCPVVIVHSSRAPR